MKTTAEINGAQIEWSVDMDARVTLIASYGGYRAYEWVQPSALLSGRREEWARYLPLSIVQAAAECVAEIEYQVASGDKYERSVEVSL